MHLFLFWHNQQDDRLLPDPETVADDLRQVFAPVYSTAPAGLMLRGQSANLVALLQPSPGWRPAALHEDDRGWVFAADYPVNGPAVLGPTDGGGRFLRDLAFRLQTDPRSLLAELAPPFCLAWSDGPDTFVHNDGLGMTQLFEYRDGDRWALSNKLLAFKSLGLPVEPDPGAWAVRVTLGWFPLDLSGYRRVRFVDPGTGFRVNAGGVTRTRTDVLGEWVRPDGLSPDDCLELVRASVRGLLAGCLPLWDRPEVGLTGGWDSRAVVATLRALAADFSAVVRGLPGRHDVVIARELARVAGLELEVQQAGGLPPADAAECRRCVTRALVWQGGHAAAHRHKTFLAGRPGLRPKRVNVTGQHGEIGRRERALFGDDHAARVRPGKLTARGYEDLVRRDLLADMPPFLRPALRDAVRGAIEAALRQADRYGLAGFARLDFFSLYEFTRRKGAGVHAWQPRQLVAPFLAPGFIRGVFGYPDRTDPNAFHRHIIRANAPDWAGVPFYEDLEARRAASPADPDEWRRPHGRENYDGPLYWQTAGRPLIEEALAAGGFWTEVFDPDLAANHWRSAPDALVLLHLLPQALGNS